MESTELQRLAELEFFKLVAVAEAVWAAPRVASQVLSEEGERLASHLIRGLHQVDEDSHIWVPPPLGACLA